MEQLQCLDPSVQPRVSDHIPQIIDLINQVLTSSGSFYLVSHFFAYILMQLSDS